MQQVCDEKNYPGLVEGDGIIAHSVHFEMIIQVCRKINIYGNEKTETCSDLETYRFATVYPPNDNKNVLFSFICIYLVRIPVIAHGNFYE